MIEILEYSTLPLGAFATHSALVVQVNKGVVKTELAIQAQRLCHLDAVERFLFEHGTGSTMPGAATEQLVRRCMDVKAHCELPHIAPFCEDNGPLSMNVALSLGNSAIAERLVRECPLRAVSTRDAQEMTAALICAARGDHVSLKMILNTYSDWLKSTMATEMYESAKAIQCKKILGLQDVCLMKVCRVYPSWLGLVDNHQRFPRNPMVSHAHNQLLQVPERDACTPLHLAIAASQGQLESVAAIVGLCPQTVGCVDSNGQTPLHYAAQMCSVDSTVGDQIEITKLLLEANADPFQYVIGRP